MRSYCDLLIVVLSRRQRDGDIAKRIRPYSRGPLGINKQQYDPTDQHECSDDWRDKVLVRGLKMHSKEVHRLSRSREGDARVSEHYDA